jgi:hypothetical protein
METSLTEISAAIGCGDGDSMAALSVSVNDFVVSLTCNCGEYALLVRKLSWSEHGKPLVSPTARSQMAITAHTERCSYANSAMLRKL